MASEICQYVTCPKGHKVFVVWSDEKQCFAFTCDDCDQHSLRAVSMHGTIQVAIVGPGRRV